MKKIAFMLILGILSGCVAPYQKYTCDNGTKIQAQFQSKEVNWSVRRKGLILDMVALPKVTDKTYQNKYSTIKQIENNKIDVQMSPDTKLICTLDPEQ